MGVVSQYAVVGTDNMDATSKLLEHIRIGRTSQGQDILPAYEVRQLENRQEILLQIDGDDYIRLHNMVMRHLILWYKVSLTLPEGWENVHVTP